MGSWKDKEKRWLLTVYSILMQATIFFWLTGKQTVTLTISASPTYKKSPEAMALIHCLAARSVATEREIYRPINDVKALPTFKSNALRIDRPLCSRMAKSPADKQVRRDNYNESYHHIRHFYVRYLPSSCGSSWQRTASDVARPDLHDEEKAAPIANPSAKLWMESPMVIIKGSRRCSVDAGDKIIVGTGVDSNYPNLMRACLRFVGNNFTHLFCALSAICLRLHCQPETYVQHNM